MAARWDLLLVGMAAVHAAASLLAPSAAVIAVGVWWNSNTVAHNFVHRPFFRLQTLNLIFSAAQSVLIGVPQVLWRDRHLAHHAGVSWRLRCSPRLAFETMLVGAFWITLATTNGEFFATVYLPGYVAGLALCAIQGHYEHAGATTSHYGWLYNALCFNDGYHVEHHAYPGVHWTMLPQRVLANAAASRWPPLLRWIDDLRRPDLHPLDLRPHGHTPQGPPSLPTPETSVPKALNCMKVAASAGGRSAHVRRLLDVLERLVLRWPGLQRFVLRVHRHAFRALLGELPPLRRVAVVGGGLFPRTAIVLRDLAPDAEITVIEANARHVDTARELIDGRVVFRHAWFSPGAPLDVDLVVIPLAFDGDLAAIYHQPPAPAVLVHDWAWRRRGRGCVISLALLKRLNLVRAG